MGVAEVAVRRVVARCRRGFPDADLDEDLRGELARVVPFDFACWGLLDPGTLWPVTSRGTRPSGVAAIRAWEYELAVPDVNKIAELATTPGHVGVLSLATGGEPERSARYRGVLGPLGVSDELRLVLSLGGIGWGWLALFRAGTARFSAVEARRIAGIGPHLAHAWRKVLLSIGSGADPDGRPPAVVVLDAEDRIESMTPGSQDLLARLPEGRTTPIADVLHALALAARQGLAVPLSGISEGEEMRGAARAMMPRGDGSWLRLHAAPLVGAGDRVAVTLQPANRSEIGVLLLGAYALTPRETEVALAAIRNQTNPQIAAELGLSAWTVQDHLKSVFSKTGVHSRRELSTRFFRPPTQPDVSPAPAPLPAP